MYNWAVNVTRVLVRNSGVVFSIDRFPYIFVNVTGAGSVWMTPGRALAKLGAPPIICTTMAVDRCPDSGITAALAAAPLVVASEAASGPEPPIPKLERNTRPEPAGP